MNTYPLIYRWRRYRPEWYGRRCHIIARGTMNSRLVEFENGKRAVVSGYSLRRAGDDGEGGG